MWKDPLKIVNHHLANITDTKEEVADGFSRSFKAVQPCSFLGFVYVFNQSFSTNRFQQIINIGGKIQAGNIQEKTTNKNNCIHKYLIKSLLLQAQDWLPGVWSYRCLLNDWSAHAVRTKCSRLTSNSTVTWPSQVFSGMSSFRLSIKRFLSVLWTQ